MKSTPAGHKPVPLATTTPGDPKSKAGGSGGKNSKPGEMEVFGAQRKPVLPPRLYPLASPRHPTTAPDRSAWMGGGSTVQVLAGLSAGARKGRPITSGDLPLPNGTWVTDGKVASWLVAGRMARLVTDDAEIGALSTVTDRILGLHYSFEPSRYASDMPQLGRADHNATGMTMLLGGNQGYFDGTFTDLHFVETAPGDVLAATMAQDAADISDDEILFMQSAGTSEASPPGYLVLLQGMPDEPGLRNLLTTSLALPKPLLDIVSDYLTQPKTPHTAEGWRKLGFNDIVPVNGLLVMVCSPVKQQGSVTAMDVFHPRTEGTLQGPAVKWDPRMMATNYQAMKKFSLHVSPALPYEPALLREHVGTEPPRLSATRGDGKGFLRFRGHIYTIKLPDTSQYPGETPLPPKAPEASAPKGLTSWNPLAHWRKPQAPKPGPAAPAGGLTTAGLELRNDRPETERTVRVTDANGVTRTGTLQPIADDGEVWVTFDEADFTRQDRAASGIRWAQTTTPGINSCLLGLDRFKVEWENP